jgi:UTP:GlnB (protein PII) uridylyltransferase
VQKRWLAKVKKERKREKKKSIGSNTVGGFGRRELACMA